MTMGIEPTSGAPVGLIFGAQVSGGQADPSRVWPRSAGAGARGPSPLVATSGFKLRPRWGRNRRYSGDGEPRPWPSPRPNVNRKNPPPPSPRRALPLRWLWRGLLGLLVIAALVPLSLWLYLRGSLAQLDGTVRKRPAGRGPADPRCAGHSNDKRRRSRRSRLRHRLSPRARALLSDGSSATGRRW